MKKFFIMMLFVAVLVSSGCAGPEYYSRTETAIRYEGSVWYPYGPYGHGRPGYYRRQVSNGFVSYIVVGYGSYDYRERHDRPDQVIHVQPAPVVVYQQQRQPAHRPQQQQRVQPQQQRCEPQRQPQQQSSHQSQSRPQRVGR